MENPYIKQYPDLMSGKKIMYVHGFMSSAQSGTVKMLQQIMPNATICIQKRALLCLSRWLSANSPTLS